MACEACHAAKVKCETDSGCCVRCARLQIECVPHVSLQGKGSKRRKTGSSLGVEKQFVKMSSQLSGCDPIHYGVNHIIRQWFFLSFSRRSFRLLEVASRLANRVGIDMNQILLGNNLPKAWFSSTTRCSAESIESSSRHAVTFPSENQTVRGPKLEISDIPMEVWQKMRCTQLSEDDRQASTKVNLKSLHSRWIFVRETRGGQARFFVSEAFERDIAPLSAIHLTWDENKQPVKELWGPSAEPGYCNNFIRAISRYQTPQSHSAPIRSTGTKRIRLLTGEEIATDSVWFLYHIVDLDKAFSVTEFIPPKDFFYNRQASRGEETTPFTDASQQTVDVNQGFSEIESAMEGADRWLETLLSTEDTDARTAKEMFNMW